MSKLFKILIFHGDEYFSNESIHDQLIGSGFLVYSDSTNSIKIRFYRLLLFIWIIKVKKWFQKFKLKPSNRYAFGVGFKYYKISLSIRHQATFGCNVNQFYDQLPSCELAE